jgi:hypothetical protein
MVNGSWHKKLKFMMTRYLNHDLLLALAPCAFFRYLAAIEATTIISFFLQKNLDLLNHRG